MKRKQDYKLGGDVVIDERFSDLGERKVYDGVGYSQEVWQANKTQLTAVVERNEQLPTPLESEEHIELVNWCQANEDEYPELAGLVHIPNGEYRDKGTGAKLKQMSVQSGYPDLLLDIARGQFHGFRLEMKRIDGRKPRDSQEVWIRWLKQNGYCVVVAYGWVQARDAILEYLSLPKTIVVDGYLLEYTEGNQHESNRNSKTGN